MIPIIGIGNMAGARVVIETREQAREMFGAGSDLAEGLPIPCTYYAPKAPDRVPPSDVVQVSPDAFFDAVDDAAAQRELAATWPAVACQGAIDFGRLEAKLKAFARLVSSTTWHGPEGKGGLGPCRSVCAKCEAERILNGG